ncbi:MAG: sulfatase-like hydrolase/transferase [Clostridia bacterium]|nr:sulfatase-like hydrolase/transferase [Clostridia bacterium]
MDLIKRLISDSSDRHGPFKGLVPVLFFPFFSIYMELMLRLMAKDIPFFDLSLVRILLFAIPVGLIIGVIVDIIPQKIVARVIGGIIVVASFILYGIEFCCMDFYGTYFGFGYMAGMTGQVVDGFKGTITQVAGARIPQILVLFIPVVLYFVFIRIIIPLEKSGKRFWIISLVSVLVLLIAGSLLSFKGPDNNYATYDFEPNMAIQRYGLVDSLILEARYGVFGKPEMPLPEINPDEPLFTTFEPSMFTETTTVSSLPDTGDTDPAESSEEPAPTPTPYPFNITDIDFETLYNETDNNTIKGMHLYFGNNMPTQQNEYTGMFEGKNLILITAEAFCPYAIDKDYTPTLYKLANEGFVFTDFYQPNWHLSTTGGEFAVMTGQIPQWIGSSNSFYASRNDYMPYGFGYVFGDMGYSTPAWHNGAYTFYDRDKTHPNLGYDFSAINHGLEVESLAWPASDYEMFEATVDSYIDDYVNNGTKFHAYYMTVSGHCNYSWAANAMSKRNKDSAIEAFPDSSQTIQAYMACNKELDKGLEYLLDKLEKAGIADDTVIVMCADHYPYGMANGGTDYYDELSGMESSEQDIIRYKNTLVLWCGSIEEPIIVDTPCSSIDIIPTLMNLFGIEYDSRLFPGRDIFAPVYDVNSVNSSMPLVILPVNAGNSWKTQLGEYDCKTKEFIPKPGVTVPDDYVDNVNQLVKDKWKYSGYIIQYDYFKYIFEQED